TPQASDNSTVLNVGDFVAVNASKNRRAQQHSTSGPQQIQYQSFKNNKFQQSSTRFWIWFGTRCSTWRPSLQVLALAAGSVVAGVEADRDRHQSHYRRNRAS